METKNCCVENRILVFAMHAQAWHAQKVIIAKLKCSEEAKRELCADGSAVFGMRKHDTLKVIITQNPRKGMPQRMDFVGNCLF